MRYCSNCGHEVLFSIPEGDNRSRYWCQHCGTIHYQNPRIVVGSVPIWEGRVLLCKRAIPPRLGYWTLPAGFMENGETLQEGAERETREEACATVLLDQLYTVFSLAHINQVYAFFLGELVEGKYAVGEETADADLFSADQIPWDELAFPVIHKTLKYYLRDRKNGHFLTRTRDIAPMSLRR